MEKLPLRRPRTPGYASDICREKISLTCGLVHQHSIQSFNAKYDTMDSTVLGSGSCGLVSTVRHRETGDIFAVKVVGAHGNDGMDALRKEIELLKRLDDHKALIANDPSRPSLI